MHHFICAILFALAGCATSEQLENYTLHDVFFDVETPLQMSEHTSHRVSWGTFRTGIESFNISVIKGQEILSVSHDGSVRRPNFTDANETFGDATNVTDDVITMGSFSISTKAAIGYATLNLTLLGGNETALDSKEFKMTVVMLSDIFSDIFSIGLLIISAVNFINMGTKLKKDIVLSIMKKPIGPAIGLVSQYISMPLIAYGLGILLFPDNELYRIGQFATGVAPGGLLSNIWTHLLGGSLDLSVTMTMVSSVAATGIIPLWIFTLGQSILDGADFVIPFKNVFIGMAFIIITLGIGFAMQFVLPKVAAVIEKLMTFTSLVTIVFGLTVGVYANRQVMTLFSWKIVLAGVVQALSGHVIGLVLAYLFKRSREEMIAISVEVALQNNQLALVFLDVSFERPANEIARTMPFAAFFTTQSILLPFFIAKCIYNYRKKRSSVNIEKNELNEQQGSSSLQPDKGIDNEAMDNL